MKFLGEEDYLTAMNTTVKDFREQNVTRGTYRAPDGTELNYYYAIPEDAEGIVVMVHGMCEFYGKYHEYSYYLYEAGFGFFFMEQRSHGYSGGKLTGKNYDIIDIDDFDTYVEDLHGFIDNVVIKADFDKNLPLLLLAHSMGGAVGALFLEKYPGYFKGAVFSSPMFRIKGLNMSTAAVYALKAYATATHQMQSPGPGQQHFIKNPDISTGSEQSVVRSEYIQWQRLADEHYQTGGGSYSFGIASILATKKLIAGADKIKIPVTVLTAGDDHLINPEGYYKFSKKVPQAVFHEYIDSRHEIFNSDDRSRRLYFRKVLMVLDNYCNE